jgi:hypothetical protein
MSWKPPRGQDSPFWKGGHIASARRWRNTPTGRESTRARHERAYHRVRAKVVALLGGKCAECSVSDPRVLEINHIHGGGRKEVSHGRGIAFLYDILAGRRRTDDLNVLCRPCNAVDHLYRQFPELRGTCRVAWELTVTAAP